MTYLAVLCAAILHALLRSPHPLTSVRGVVGHCQTVYVCGAEIVLCLN